MKPRALVGPVVVAAWVIAGGWVAVAAAVLASNRGLVALTIAAASLLLAVGTAWVGFGMLVRVSAAGVLVGRRLVPWNEVDGLAIRRGGGPIPLQVPVLARRRGRALVEVELDGLARVGDPARAARAVLPIAEQGQVEVAFLGHPASAAAARRASN